jgi:hypothetical protein
MWPNWLPEIPNKWWPKKMVGKKWWAKSSFPPGALSSPYRKPRESEAQARPLSFYSLYFSLVVALTECPAINPLRKRVG